MKYTRALSLLAAVFVGAFAAAQSCFATTYYVSNKGSDSNSGRYAAPFATLYKAVSVVQPGDTVDIDGGTYILANAEAPYSGYPVDVVRSGTAAAPITIQSTPGQRAVIDAANLWEPSYDGIDINANDIVVQNLTVENAGAIDLVIEDGSNCTVQRCTFVGGVWGGVEIGDFTSRTEMTGDAILDCDVHDNSTVNTDAKGANWGGGLGMNDCTDSVVRGNAVYHNWGEGLTTGAWNGYPCSGNTVTNNTVYDNWSVELYLNCTDDTTVSNNFVYADADAPLRGGFPAIGIAVDNESTTYLGYGCRILNNIVIGGMESFRYANTNTYSGFYNGGLNGFAIENNVFYNTSPFNTGAYPACVQIDNDPNNNFTWENNIVWERKSGVVVAADGGGGTQVLSNNCWDGNGGDNMAGAGDVDLIGTSPGFTGPALDSPADWTLTRRSPCLTAGANLTSDFGFDFNNAPRPATGAWTMGAFAAATAPAPAFVQATSNDPVSGAVVSLPFSSPQDAGDLNIVVVGCNSTNATVKSVTDSNGNIYSAAVGPIQGYAQRQWIYYASGIKSGPNTVTVAMNKSVSYPDIRILEYSGVSTFDAGSWATGKSATATSGEAITTSPRELIFVADTCYPTTTALSAGYTVRLSTIDGDIAGDKIASTQGPKSASATLSSANYWLMSMATFK